MPSYSEMHPVLSKGQVNMMARSIQKPWHPFVQYGSAVTTCSGSCASFVEGLDQCHFSAQQVLEYIKDASVCMVGAGSYQAACDCPLCCLHGTHHFSVLVQEGDAYAFGVMLCELYTGQPAWAGMSTGDIISAKLRTHASQALRMSADCPPALQVPKTVSCAVACLVLLIKGFCSILMQSAVMFGSLSASLSVLCDLSLLPSAACL